MNYTVTQTVTLDAGVYAFGGYLEGSTDGTEDTYKIYVSNNGQEQTVSAEMNGWQNWSNPEIQDITITKDNTEIILGIRAKASANAWVACGDSGAQCNTGTCGDSCAQRDTGASRNSCTYGG